MRAAVNYAKPIEFIRANGDTRHRGSLGVLLESRQPSDELIQSVPGDQQTDGGWSVSSHDDVSSVNQTLWHLTLAEEAGIDAGHERVRRACNFPRQAQETEWSWGEHVSLAAVSPPWGKPGDLASGLYLTACAGRLLVTLDGDGEQAARRAGLFLASHADAFGRLPSFLHTHWLAAALWWGVGTRGPQKRPWITS